MAELQLGAVEAKFADIVWSNAPVSTTALVKLCEQALAWKRTTTYTVLKRLSEKGLFETDQPIRLKSGRVIVGVRPEHITVSDLCTQCHADTLWSHRATGGKRGSLAGLIMMTKD